MLGTPREPLMAASSDLAATGRPATGVGSDDLMRDVVAGLRRRPKQIPARYLYDALGSQLFEAICELPWYPITRSERTLLERECKAILERLDTPATLVELGGGNGEKLSILAEGLTEAGRAADVHLIDISATALDRARQKVAHHEAVRVHGHRTTYAEGLRTVVARLAADRSTMVLFLGSNIGNLTPNEADGFVAAIHEGLRSGDSFLLGADLVKPEAELVAAYDDPLGVTAAFNRNLLVRLNRELDADFDLEQFAHQVIWNPRDARIESYLVSQTDQTVCLRGADSCVRLDAGEGIWTESSYKYTPDQIVALGERAGFVRRAQWIEEQAQFALTLFDRP